MLRLIVDNGPIETPKGTAMFINHNFNVAPLGSNYGEWSYFDGYAFAHIAAWQDEQRLRRIRKDATKCIENERRKNGRALFR
jgi:hypothetical protein